MSPPSRAAARPQPSPEPPPAADDGRRVTPFMAQYLEIKAANAGSLLFFRMGDFYELFFDDAEVASRALGIVLTKRGKHNGDDIPMCGVPVDRSDDYLHRLIALGHRVAVCEQVEDPAEARKRGAKSVVRREVIRLVTPGTITEEHLLEPGRANVLLVISRVRLSDGQTAYGLAATDISTGSFRLSEAREEDLASEIARAEPSEIVAAEALCAEPAFRRLAEEAGVALSPLAREQADRSAEQKLLDYFHLATLEGLGTFARAEIAAAAATITYLERTQIGARVPLDRPLRLARGASLEIDAATRANLELTRTLGGERDGSLLAAINLTVTPAGSRLLSERLAAPLTSQTDIANRLDAVEFFCDAPSLRSELRARLKAAPDFGRALSRLALGRAGPRDLATIRDGLAAARGALAVLASEADLPAEVAAALDVAAQLDPALESALAVALGDELPLNRRDGGFVRDGHDPALDEARTLRDASRRVIASLQARYCELAETRQLRIKHNNFLGFFLEVPQAHGERLLKPPLDQHFVHRQTMADAMRFSTAELAELEAKIADAADRALALELAIFDRIAGLVLDAAERLKAAAQALAVIDVAAALAELAAERGWTRPHVDQSLIFAIESGRHPVVEAAMKARGESFIANDCTLSDTAGTTARIALVTGPNMAGKSTYLRQNALIAVLAQAGSFVPAASARIGIVDRLFSRVGAADDLARGRSTFMVEMVETAAILNQATPRSLVILDEIGRGTATFDGLSIAWSAVEHLHQQNRSRTLFATHFHELTQLARKLPRLINLTMRVTEWSGDVVFLHEVVAGAADRSYGIQVAKLAGLPSAVIARAQKLLAELEATERRLPIERLIDDLPLFAAAAQKPAEPPAAAPDRLRVALEALAPDEMTPREALEAVYRLKRLARGEGAPP